MRAEFQLSLRFMLAVAGIGLVVILFVMIMMSAPLLSYLIPAAGLCVLPVAWRIASDVDIGRHRRSSDELDRTSQR
jgi:hypothetical protein